MRFLPDCTDLDNLCGPAFKKACSFELRNIVDTQEVTLNGKIRKMQTLTPISTAVAVTRSGGSVPSTGGNTGGSTGGNDGGGGNGGGGGDDMQI